MTSLVLALLLTYAPQQAGSLPLSPALEARVMALGKQLRCAVCQGVAIADSPASMARAQLDRVRELVSEGRSDAEIRDYFVARYGEWVLLEPTAHGLNWLVWAAPVLLLLVGGAMIAAQIRRRGPPSSSDSDRESEPQRDGDTQGDPDRYRDAVRRELDR